MKGIIINWAGTIASIPTDWLLCDGANSTPNLLGKYLLSVGAAENPGTTGGSATHTHSSTAHGHTQDTHSHTGTTSSGGTTALNEYSGYPIASTAIAGHAHTYTVSSVVATNQTTAVTTDTASNDPVYYKVAPIIDNSLAGVKYPASSLIFWGQATLPLGWSACDGSGGTPDLRNKFLKCVDSAENPGATGGSATHTHTPNSHTHIQDTHSHTGTSNGSNSWASYRALNHNEGIAWAHTHALTISSDVAVNQSSDITLDTINGEPTFKKLLIIKNTGVANRPKYAIVEWSGTIANIPLGYVLCDGNNGTPNLLDYFIKGALDSSELSNTGGSSVHGHTASTHNHTQNGHTHTVSGDNGGSTAVDGFGSGQVIPFTAHAHGNASSTSTTATNQATTITINNSDSQANYPPYYKVAFIMQDRELDVGAYAFMIN